MCQDHGTAAQARASAPRPIRGAAVDPIALEPVDEITITVLVDNIYDGLLTDAGPARRTPLPRSPAIAAGIFQGGRVAGGLVAEHGFSALVRVRVGERTHTLLFDTGISPNGMADNLERLGIDAGEIEAVVLSHGHFDHAGGLAGLARLRRGSGLPMTVHPEVWNKRRILLPGNNEWLLPALSRSALEGEGFTVIERRTPSLLLDGAVLITGEVDRTTEFERGMANHQAFRDGDWVPDPLIVDDQALVVHVRGRGLVVLTGCGHAGAINIARHAGRLTGVDRLDALLGGFHLSGPAFEPVIEPTVAALTELAPSLLVPAHCTGWRAQHRLAAALPAAFMPNSVGSSYTLAAA
jgi:7,8-dihydropterin-6-yl-methyl-4-(beta-D-ribofuranosyl)aminobenzene 5'-phosphate synthase